MRTIGKRNVRVWHVVPTELADAVHCGIAALLRYKLRTTLSVLGVVLGVAGVVAMVSVGEGARRQTLAQVQSLGLDNVVVRSRMPSTGGHTPGVRLDDLGRIRELVPDVTLLSPLVERHVRRPGASEGGFIPVVGVDAQMASILRLRVAEGRFLSVVDERHGAAACVLGAGLASALGERRGRLIGAYVRLGHAHCQVIGVLESSGRETTAATDPAWRNLDQAALMPVASVTGRSGLGAPHQRVDEIWLQIPDAERVEPSARLVERVLAGRGLRRQDVDLIIPRQLLAQRHRTHRTFNVVTGSVAALALLVGGIGVMNVMLMSVVERTHEIGIRRTVGARRSAIARQFLFESVLMTLCGGITGILLGGFLARLVTWYAGWPTAISAWSVAAAIGVAAAVGVGFGLYPAMTAARLSPMEALRRE